MPEVGAHGAGSSVAVAGSFADGFWSSWSMILVSEIGDKTFFIALLMSLRYPRLIVFAGAIAALSVMTVLSALMGVLVPTLLSVRVTQMLAVVLFTGFGAKILRDTLAEKKDGESDSDDERAEAAAAIGPKEGDVEAGTGNVAAPSMWGVLVQSFTLTFVAEWGDRSQIATIALAAAKNAYGVTLGGVVGHSICTGCACLAGNLIASKVSHRSVNICGGVLFIFFGIYTAWELYATSGSATSDSHAPTQQQHN
jgi:putative Ca2+/H+ antiporter (TMEM165/GDT1 family)